MTETVNISGAVRRLTRVVNAVIDPQMHRAPVREFLSGTPVDEVVEALRMLITDFDKAGFRQTYFSVIQCLLGRELHYGQVEELYRVACLLECEPLRYILLRVPSRLQAQIDEVLPDPETRELPLGVRKALARCNDRDRLTRLALDPSVPVVRILLGNPRVVEKDVVRIAARRPNLADVLTLVSQHPRWAQRYEVQLALVQNPYTPTPIASALTPFLHSADLTLVATNDALHEAVRSASQTVCRWREARR